MTALSVELGGITFDGETNDSGLIWCAEMIDGWHDSAPVTGALSQLPLGQIVTAVHEQGRALVLRGSVKSATGSGALGDDWFVAERELKAAMRFQYVAGLLEVTEPDITLQAYVRRVDSKIRMTRKGKLSILSFEVPLLAPDPRRYDGDATTFTGLLLAGAATTVTASTSSAGDQPTSPVLTIDGPATNPKVTHNGLGMFVLYSGTLGGSDSLVLDLGAETAILNGTTDVRSSVSPSTEWWPILPGSNSLTYERSAGASNSTAQVVYRDAYS